jgi:hypothetical protein
MAFVDEESVRTERMELVLFPVMMTSEGKVYVPAPKVPPVVVMTPVPLVYEMTEAPEREEEEILLLKLVQSEDVRQPKVPLLAVLQMSWPPESERPAPKPLKDVPLSERTLVLIPFDVVVPETKRMEVEAVPEKVAPLPETFPLDVMFVVESPWSEEVPLVAVIVPAVMKPMFAAGPEEEPVTFPIRLPVMPFVTTRLVVVAVPETTSCEVEAELVAVSVPTVALPRIAFPVTFPVRFPVKAPVMTPATERFAALMLFAVMLPVLTPRKVEVPLVAVKEKPVMEPKTSRTLFVVVLDAPMSTCAVVVEGRYRPEVYTQSLWEMPVASTPQEKAPVEAL